MLKRRLALLGLALSCAACVKSARSEATPADPDREASDGGATTQVEAEPGQDLGATRFWVMSSKLEAYDLDGKVVETALLGEPGELGEFAIVLADRRVLSIATQGSETLLVIASIDGTTRETVPLPNLFDFEHCELRPARPGEFERNDQARVDDDYDAITGVEMRVTAAHEFRIGRDADVACPLFMDLDSNVASQEVVVGIDLDTHEITGSALLYDAGANCEVEEPPAGCEEYLHLRNWIEGPPEPAPRSWALRYDEAKGWLLDAAGKRVADLCRPGVRDQPNFTPRWGECAAVALESSSGRWLMLDTNVDEGDYIDRDIVFLDLERGVFWMVVYDDEQRDQWVQIEAAALFERPAQGHQLHLLGAVETDTLPHDRFWIEGGLFIPERQEIVGIGGSLAQLAAP